MQALKRLLKRNKELEKIEAEHQRINGELRERVKELEENNRIGNKAYEDIIKELNEENNRCAMLAVAKNDLEEKLRKERYYSEHNVEVFKQTSIPKLKIKEKIEELKDEYKIALEENSTKAFILKCQIQVLEELLKGE